MLFFFFKQETAYELLRSLVGSEMCIRDSHRFVDPAGTEAELSEELLHGRVSLRLEVGNVKVKRRDTSIP